MGGDSLSSIFDPAGKTIYGLGQLAQPLFEGGKLRGQLQLSQETKTEMVLTYQKTIAGAFRDVSNALIALNKQRAYREQQGKACCCAPRTQLDWRACAIRAVPQVTSKC